MGDIELQRSVVKLFTVVKEPNYYKPWELAYQHTSGGSACIIEGNRILTNAHVIAHQLFVQAQKPFDAKKYPARVLHVDHDTERDPLPTRSEGESTQSRVICKRFHAQSPAWYHSHERSVLGDEEVWLSAPRSRSSVDLLNQFRHRA